MLSPQLLTQKQQDAVTRLYSHDETILIAPTGAGKTVICLTAIKELIEEGHLHRVIVACPARVVPVWVKEVAQWTHLAGLTVTALAGTPVKRFKKLEAEASDVLVISLNSLEWLLECGHGADGIIIDELSKASGKQAARLRYEKYGANLKWRVGMTATPVSQDFEKLYAMCRIIDGGKALGTRKESYLQNYFYSDYMGYNHTLKDDGAERIMAKVKGLIHSIEDTKKDDLPALTEKVIRFHMPTETRVVYDQMKKDMVAGDVEAANEAVKSGKLRQIASGFMYDALGEPDRLDSRRLDIMNDGYVADIAKKIVVFYEFVGQYDELRLRFDGAWSTEDVEVFKTTNIPILLAQINSLSHGVDGLQHVCSDALFYHPMWSRDATEQAIGRLWRTGQTKPVTITTLVCNDTLDDLVMARVESKADFMRLFNRHLKG